MSCSISALVGFELAQRAHSLESEGLSEIGWELGDALSVVSALERRGGALLGGDVYRREEGRPVPTYDSWHCERRPDESAKEFVVRSAQVARNYLHSYPSSDGQTIFVLVLDTSIAKDIADGKIY